MIKHSHLWKLMLTLGFCFNLVACQVSINERQQANAKTNIGVEGNGETEVNIKTNNDVKVNIDEKSTYRERRRKKVSNDIVVERTINSLQRKLETDTKFNIKDGAIVDPPVGANIRITEKLKNRVAKGTFKRQQGNLVLVITDDPTGYVTEMYGSKEKWAKSFLKSMEGDSQLKVGVNVGTDGNGGVNINIKVPDMPSFNDDDN